MLCQKDNDEYSPHEVVCVDQLAQADVWGHGGVRPATCAGHDMLQVGLPNRLGISVCFAPEDCSSYCDAAGTRRNLRSNP